MLDGKAQLIQTWQINSRLNLYMLEAIPQEQLATGLGKGKSVEGQFAHMNNVRLMWLKPAAPDLLESLLKLEPTGLQKAGIQEAMEKSGVAISELIARSWDNEGKVKGFKPHVAGFVGYMISHEANHRAHIELALRQAGTPLTDKVAYGVWEWGVR